MPAATRTVSPWRVFGWSTTVVLTAGLLLVAAGVVALPVTAVVVVTSTAAVTAVVALSGWWRSRWAALWPLWWGACVAAPVAAAVNTAALIAAGVRSGDSLPLWAPVLLAPLVEETVKFAGVLLLVHRRQAVGLVDVAVAVALIGLGFAATENVLYVAAGADSAGALGAALVLMQRAVLTPFAHPLFGVLSVVFAACLAAGRRPSPVVVALAAMLLHALWNYSTTIPVAWLVVYVGYGAGGAVAFGVLARSSMLERHLAWPSSAAPSARRGVRRRLPVARRAAYDRWVWATRRLLLLQRSEVSAGALPAAAVDVARWQSRWLAPPPTPSAQTPLPPLPPPGQVLR